MDPAAPSTPFTKEQLAWLQATFGPPGQPGTSAAAGPSERQSSLREPDGTTAEATAAPAAGERGTGRGRSSRLTVAMAGGLEELGVVKMSMRTRAMSEL